MKNTVLKSIILFLTACAVIIGNAFAQVTYSGPASGSVSSGIIVSTGSFKMASPPPPYPIVKEVKNKFNVPIVPTPANMPSPIGAEGSNFILDRSVQNQKYSPTSTYNPITLNSFAGIPQTNYVPPDPHMAVGPNHVITAVNSTFRISDKAGNTLGTYNTNTWFASSVPGLSVSDPKIVYDHLAGRWLVVCFEESDALQRSNFLIAVSDDSNPLGTWVNYALSSTVNGSTPSGTWGDYEGVGYDDQAVYITTNNFSFAGSYQYSKLRIIPKSGLYANTAGPVTWTDIWNIKDAQGQGTYRIRPALMLTTANEYYLVSEPQLSTRTYLALFKLTNPVTNPVMTGVSVPVTAYSAAPNGNQLGGGTAIESGTQLFEPTYRDTSLWISHSISSGTGYSRARYVRINTSTNTAVEDVAFGADGYYYMYPAIAVDKYKNVMMTFTRSGTTEYPGAYYTWRSDNDPSGLNPAQTIVPGGGNYNVVAGGRNRWGDYMGIDVDPKDGNNFWMHTEYAAAPSNTWAVQVHNVMLTPYSSRRIFANKNAVNFGNIETGFSSDTIAVTAYNYGSTQLSVSSISANQSSVKLLGLPSLPKTLNLYDSLVIKVAFVPTTHGTLADTITIASNDTTRPALKIPLGGKGIQIGRALAGVPYSVSSAAQLFKLNVSNGTATLVGALNSSSLIQGLTVRPSTKELYGYAVVGATTSLYRVSSNYGDALPYRTLSLPSVKNILFAGGDTLYGVTGTGFGSNSFAKLYRLNITTGDTIFIGAAAGIGSGTIAMSFNPITGKLWYATPASGETNVYTVNPSSGQATLVGQVGLGLVVSSLAFDALGRLYGLTNNVSGTNNLLRINTSTGAGTLIGATGPDALQSLAMRIDSVMVGVPEQVANSHPDVYQLNQNYPNPFNPSTTIAFALPKSENVTLKVYDVLGREVTTLMNERKPAGSYTVNFDASKFSSGTYLYKLTAGNFVETKKMVLVK